MKRKAPAIAAVVGVAVLALIAVLVVSPGSKQDSPESPLIGNTAPALAGATLGGGEFDLDDHRGEWVVVNFFATWCPPCVEEHPELVVFSERNEGSVQVVSVAFDDTELDAVERFFAKHGGEWPVIIDGAGGASLDYGVKRLPESFLVDPSGAVTVKINGGVTAAQLESLIADHVTGTVGETG